MNTEKIIWKKHPVYENYEANQFGEARCTNYFNKEGYTKILMQKIDKYSGGKRVCIKGKTMLAHRFIYECFYGLIPKGYEIDHLDGNHANNAIDNLKCCKHVENCHNPITMERYKKAKRVEIVAYDKKTGKIIGTHSSSEWSKILNICKTDIMAAARMKYVFEYISK